MRSRSDSRVAETVERDKRIIIKSAGKRAVKVLVAAYTEYGITRCAVRRKQERYSRFFLRFGVFKSGAVHSVGSDFVSAFIKPLIAVYSRSVSYLVRIVEVDVNFGIFFILLFYGRIPKVIRAAS